MAAGLAARARRARVGTPFVMHAPSSQTQGWGGGGGGARPPAGPAPGGWAASRWAAAPRAPAAHALGDAADSTLGGAGGSAPSAAAPKAAPKTAKKTAAPSGGGWGAALSSAGISQKKGGVKGVGGGTRTGISIVRPSKPAALR